MERPNTFIIQQGRAAESVLMEIVKKILAARHPGKVFTIPSNGHFDTTEGNIKQMGSIPRNLYHKELLYQVPEGGKYEKNPFKGNMDIEKLEQLIHRCRPRECPAGLHLHHQQPHLRPAGLHGATSVRSTASRTSTTSPWSSTSPAGPRTATSSR